MLILSRKRNESIVIDDEIVVQVLEVKGEQVRLGISAPKSVSVHRSEVYEAMQQQKSENTQQIDLKADEDSTSEQSEEEIIVLN